MMLIRKYMTTSYPLNFISLTFSRWRSVWSSPRRFSSSNITLTRPFARWRLKLTRSLNHSARVFPDWCRHNCMDMCFGIEGWWLRGSLLPDESESLGADKPCSQSPIKVDTLCSSPDLRPNLSDNVAERVADHHGPGCIILVIWSHSVWCSISLDVSWAFLQVWIPQEAHGEVQDQRTRVFCYGRSWVLI